MRKTQKNRFVHVKIHVKSLINKQSVLTFSKTTNFHLPLRFPPNLISIDFNSYRISVQVLIKISVYVKMIYFFCMSSKGYKFWVFLGKNKFFKGIDGKFQESKQIVWFSSNLDSLFNDLVYVLRDFIVSFWLDRELELKLLKHVSVLVITVLALCKCNLFK